MSWTKLKLLGSAPSLCPFQPDAPPAFSSPGLLCHLLGRADSLEQNSGLFWCSSEVALCFHKLSNSKSGKESISPFILFRSSEKQNIHMVASLEDSWHINTILEACGSQAAWGMARLHQHGSKCWLKYRFPGSPPNQGFWVGAQESLF